MIPSQVIRAVLLCSRDKVQVIYSIKEVVPISHALFLSDNRLSQSPTRNQISNTHDEDDASNFPLEHAALFYENLSCITCIHNTERHTRNARGTQCMHAYFPVRQPTLIILRPCSRRRENLGGRFPP